MAVVEIMMLAIRAKNGPVLCLYRGKYVHSSGFTYGLPALLGSLFPVVQGTTLFQVSASFLNLLFFWINQVVYVYVWQNVCWASWMEMQRLPTCRVGSTPSMVPFPGFCNPIETWILES